jgi:hypothetical protein
MRPSEIYSENKKKMHKDDEGEQKNRIKNRKRRKMKFPHGINL